MRFHAILKNSMQRIAYTGNQWVFLLVVIECQGDLSGPAAANMFLAKDQSYKRRKQKPHKKTICQAGLG